MYVYDRNISPSYAKHGPLDYNQFESSELESQYDQNYSQLAQLEKERSVMQDKYYQKILLNSRRMELGHSVEPSDKVYFADTPEYKELSRKIKIMLLKVYKCHYYFAKPIPLAKRAEKWDLPPDALLKRLHTLATLKKVTKREVIDYVKAYIKGRTDWNRERAKKFQAVLHTIKKNGSMNTGRYILRSLQGNSTHKFDFCRVSRFHHQYIKCYKFDPYYDGVERLERMLNRRCEHWKEPNNCDIGKTSMLDTDPRLQRHFFIGPLRGYFVTTYKPDQQIWVGKQLGDPVKYTASPATEFHYAVNAHGDRIKKIVPYPPL